MNDGSLPIEKTSNIHVAQFEPLTPPKEVKLKFPLTESTAKHVLDSRNTIREILRGKDSRLLMILGPCSIHDPRSAQEYAERLAQMRKTIDQKIFPVMRVYFEKPRTITGWKGLINDPHLDQTSDINYGLRKARELLLSINEMGLPCATEFLDPIVPQYISDLISWAAVGARTTESQTHREMASGLSMPVGFKNATDGDINVALNSMMSASEPHAFLGIDQKGQTSIVRTKGNTDVHLVLRGGKKPNYSPAHIAFARVKVGASAKKRCLLVDCGHGNSNKDYKKQPVVFKSILQQISDGERSLLGMMLESHIFEGNQKIAAKDNLKYGVSITDPCLGWEDTQSLLKLAFQTL